MQIALYHGVSRMSRAIRWITRSEISHAAFVLDANSELMLSGDPGNWAPLDVKNIRHSQKGAVIEAWTPGGVRNTASISDGHDRGTVVDLYEFVAPLSLSEERRLLLFLDGEIGTPYDFRNVFRFLPIVRLLRSGPAARARGWFCSELVFAGCDRADRVLLNRTTAEEVPPDWIQRSPLLRYVKTVTA